MYGVCADNALRSLLMFPDVQGPRDAQLYSNLLKFYKHPYFKDSRQQKSIEKKENIIYFCCVRLNVEN